MKSIALVLFFFLINSSLQVPVQVLDLKGNEIDDDVKDILSRDLLKLFRHSTINPCFEMERFLKNNNMNKNSVNLLNFLKIDKEMSSKDLCAIENWKYYLKPIIGFLKQVELKNDKNCYLWSKEPGLCALPKNFHSNAGLNLIRTIDPIGGGNVLK